MKPRKKEDSNGVRSVAIYARVSTERQKVGMQIHELREYVERRRWTVYQEYIDRGFSGSGVQRPAFSGMMADARKRRFDVLLVWKLDRLSRSVKDLVNTLHELDALGVDFISYDNNLDTSTPTGKLVFHVIGAVAEFEKDIIRERVKAGLEDAKRKGTKLGRPRVAPEIPKKVAELRAGGMSFRKIGKGLGIHEATARKHLKTLP